MPALKGSGEHISLRGVLNGAACLVNSGKASFLDAVLKFYRQQSVPLQHLPKPIRDALTDPQRAYQHSLEGTTSIVAHIWLPLLLMENTGHSLLTDHFLIQQNASSYKTEVTHKVPMCVHHYHTDFGVLLREKSLTQEAGDSHKFPL